MKLTCGPSSIDIEQISASEWTLNGQQIKEGMRFEITSGSISTLTVNNVILADIGKSLTPMEFIFPVLYFELMINWLLSITGIYKCSLKGRIIDFIQEGLVTNSVIREAPVVRLQSRVNVDCQQSQFHELQCCVQFPYEVNWFQDAPLLSSMYETSNGTASVSQLDTAMKQVVTAVVTIHSRVQQQEFLLHKAQLRVRKLQRSTTN